MTSRVRWVQPPDNWVPQSGQLCMAGAGRWVGVMRARAKPCGLGLRGPLGGAGFRSVLVLGLRPGIRREFAGLAWPSNWAIRFFKRTMIACCRTMGAMRTSRSAAVTSTSVSMPGI